MSGINPIPDKKELSAVRQYFYEYVVLALVGCVIFLFAMYVKMNNYINDTLTQTIIKTTIIVEKNNDYLNRVNTK